MNLTEEDITLLKMLVSREHALQDRARQQEAEGRGAHNIRNEQWHREQASKLKRLYDKLSG